MRPWIVHKAPRKSWVRDGAIWEALRVHRLVLLAVEREAVAVAMRMVRHAVRLAHGLVGLRRVGGQHVGRRHGGDRGHQGQATTLECDTQRYSTCA